VKAEGWGVISPLLRGVIKRVELSQKGVRWDRSKNLDLREWESRGKGRDPKRLGGRGGILEASEVAE